MCYYYKTMTFPKLTAMSSLNFKVPESSGCDILSGLHCLCMSRYDMAHELAGTQYVSKYCSTVYVNNNCVSVQEHVENFIYAY